MNSRILKASLILLTVFIGLSAGLAASYMMHADDRADRAYCMEVEEGIQDSMDEGFVNCVTPDRMEANLTEEVEEGSEVRCICRRQISGVVEVFQITTAN